MNCGNCKYAVKATENAARDKYIPRNKYPLFCDRCNWSRSYEAIYGSNFILWAVDQVGCHPCSPGMFVNSAHWCAEWHAKKDE